MNCYLGVDIGKTKVALAVIGKEGSIKSYLEMPADTKEGGKFLFPQVIAGVHRILRENRLIEVTCIGVGTTGMVDHRTGTVLGSGSLPNFRNLPVRSVLERETGLPVVVENDIHAATAGEYIFGAGKEVQSMIYLGVGTGVGAGFVVGGSLYYGAHRLAGQIAHLPLFRDSLTINDLAGGKGLAARYSAIYGENLSAQRLLGDSERFREVVEEMVYSLAVVVAWLQQTIDPEVIVMGGGIMIHHPELLNEIKQRADVMLGKYSKVLQEGVPLSLSSLGKYTGVIGAASLCLMREEK